MPKALPHATSLPSAPSCTHVSAFPAIHIPPQLHTQQPNHRIFNSSNAPFASIRTSSFSTRSPPWNAGRAMITASRINSHLPVLLPSADIFIITCFLILTFIFMTHKKQKIRRCRQPTTPIFTLPSEKHDSPFIGSISILSRERPLTSSLFSKGKGQELIKYQSGSTPPNSPFLRPCQPKEEQSITRSEPEMIREQNVYKTGTHRVLS